MFRNTKVLTLCFSLFVLSHCAGGGGGKSTNSPSNLSTSPNISNIFGLPPSENGNTEKSNLITLQKSALGKEFLLQGSLAFERHYGNTVSNPTTSGMKSRIVVFQEQGDDLLMLDSDQGLQSGQEMPAHVLIATFPIKKRVGETITFDFNEGMKNVLLNGDWYASDAEGNVVLPDFTLPIENAFIRDAKIGTRALTIVQTISAAEGFGEKMMLPMEATYYLTPYQKNPNYKPVDSPGFNYLGYFEANPRVEENFGTAFSMITKYDISKPVTYYLSSAIPEKYRQAVRDGVLYWNRVFGKEIMKVADAPANMTTPDFEHNIIQWVTSFPVSAYADAQMDPKTGEVLHAQIFIQSGWADAIRAFYLPLFARSLNTKDDLKLEEEETETKEPAQTYLASKQLEATKLCELNLEEAFSSFYMNRDLVEALPEDRLEALTMDVLRTVVAHEVGHTLGLRHNFAASLVNDWSSDEEEKIAGDIIKTGKMPEKFQPPYASVMDYPNDLGNILMGEMIGNPKADPLPYDRYAIQWGYFNSDKAPQDTGLPFCTDTGTWRFDDCIRWDSGKHLVERDAAATTKTLEKMPRLLSEVYLAAKANADPKKRKPVTEASPSSFYLADSVLMPWLQLTRLLTGQINLISIIQKHPDLNDVEREKISTETLAWLNQEIVNAGGIKKVLQLIDPDWFQKTVGTYAGQFENILNSDDFKNITLYEGDKTSFTKEEIDYLKKGSKDLFAETEEKIVYNITFILQRRSPALIDSIEEVEAAIAHWADYVLNAGGQKDFRYSLKTRLQAAQLLHSKGPLPEWLAQYVSPIADKLRQKLETKFGMSIEKIKPEAFPRKDQDAVAAELTLYQMLARKGFRPGGTSLATPPVATD